MKTALVTGASEGIGLELARAFAADGWDLAIVARGEERLRAAAAELQAFGHTVATFACDLAKDGAAQQLYDAVTRAGLRIDALVNNAGVATHGKFVDISTGDELAAIHLNVIALTHLLKLFVPPMVARGSGYVLNVASTAGLQPGPTMAAYYATKAYVLSLSEALSEELRGTGVRVTALCPGPTHTGFVRRANMRSESRLFRVNAMDPKRVARAGYRGMLAGRAIVIPGFLNNLFAYAVRASPRAIVTRVVGWFNQTE